MPTSHNHTSITQPYFNSQMKNSGFFYSLQFCEDERTSSLQGGDVRWRFAERSVPPHKDKTAYQHAYIFPKVNPSLCPPPIFSKILKFST